MMNSKQRTIRFGCVVFLSSVAIHTVTCPVAADTPKAQPVLTGELDLKYDVTRHPPLKWGYNDLNLDGGPDTLITRWNGKTIAWVSDSGKLPWPADREDRDWNAYFNKAFDVGAKPPVTWNTMRSGWGGYAILVDRDDSGRFDDLADWYYKVLDLNGDGDPDGEFYHAYPGHNYCTKLHINLNGEPEMTPLN